MRASLSGLLLAAVVAASILLSPSCGEDTCRVEIQSADSGDPIELRVCATCNKGKDPQGAEPVTLDLVVNDPEVGCRCEGASCVFCTSEDCADPECRREVVTDEATGCTSPTLSLDLDDETFAEGARVPVTIEASSRFGETTKVVHLTRGAPTPTPTNTPTPTVTPTPTNTPLLGL